MQLFHAWALNKLLYQKFFLLMYIDSYFIAIALDFLYFAIVKLGIKMKILIPALLAIVYFT